MNPRTHEIERTISVDGTPTGIAAGRGGVWVAHGVAGTLERIDPRYNKHTETIAVLGPHPVQTSTISGAVTIRQGAGRAIWTAYSDSTVAKIDARFDHVSARGYAGSTPLGIAVGEDAVWVANYTGNSVTRLDPRSLQDATAAPISVGQGPSAIAVGGGAVWVADSFSDAVSRIDPLTNSSTSIPVGDRPEAIAFGYSSVWVASSRSGTVSRIDPKTNSVVATIKVGNSPAGLAVGSGRVWVTVQSA